MGLWNQCLFPHMSELFTLLIQRGLSVVLGLSDRLSVGVTILRLVIVED